MEITEKQRYDLNNRNVASQKVALGNIILNETGEALSLKEIFDCNNDNVVTQEVELGKILNAICTDTTSQIEDLTEEQIDKLNNMDVACQNCQLGTLIQAILDGTQKFVLTLTVNNDEFGSVTGAGRYIEGAEVTITASPNDHYRFVNWTNENGTIISTNVEYVFNMPTTPLHYIANFEAIPTYTLTVNSNNDELGTVSGSGEYESGTQVELTATPIGENVFTNWTLNNVEISTDNPYIYTTTAANETIVGHFEENV